MQTLVCAQPAPPTRRGSSISPIQWVGLVVFLLLLADRMGLLQLSGSGLSASGQLAGRLPFLVALLLAIPWHEFSHGLVATYFGDPTPRLARRLTLNPLRHLDPMGSLLILIVGFGWGRPMPVNPSAMRNPNLGWALTSVAGPVSNVIAAMLGIVVLRFSADQLPQIVGEFVGAFVYMNVLLAVFNLVPLPPLDGFGFVFGLAPPPLKTLLRPVLRYGPIILLALLFLPSVIPGFPPILNSYMNAGSGVIGNFLHEFAGVVGLPESQFPLVSHYRAL